MDKTIYVKTLCDFKACVLEGTNHCQKCRERKLDNDLNARYADYEGRIMILSPDLNKE